MLRIELRYWLRKSTHRSPRSPPVREAQPVRVLDEHKRSLHIPSDVLVIHGRRVMATALRSALSRRHDDVLARWVECVERSAPPQGVASRELVAPMSRFLHEMGTALGGNGDGRVTVETAADHGARRFAEGLDVEFVVREYGALRQCIVDVAHEEKVAIGPELDRSLTEIMTQGIAAAVARHAMLRQAETQRRAAERMAFVAHELRNPLSSGNLAIASLDSHGLLPSHRFVTVLVQSLARMSMLLERSIHFAALGVGVGLIRESLELSDVLHEIVTETAVDATDKDIRVEVSPAPDLWLEGDHQLIGMALGNLVRNAIKFTHRGGIVRIRCQAVETAVRIEVEDECGGIPEESIDRIFLPFFQLESKHGGFGLGLAVARQAVEAHGGTLDAFSTAGKGCVFRAVLPTE